MKLEFITKESIGEPQVNLGTQTKWQLDNPKEEPILLSGGYIPAYTQCPYASVCETKKEGRCFHYGENTPTPYVCRLIDLKGNHRPERGKHNG